MKYTISIDQTHSIAWGLSLSEAAMFSFLYSVPAWAEQIFVDNQVWFFASRNQIQFIVYTNHYKLKE
jgi:hypothetical protein